MGAVGVGGSWVEVRRRRQPCGAVYVPAMAGGGDGYLCSQNRTPRPATSGRSAATHRDRALPAPALPSLHPDAPPPTPGTPVTPPEAPPLTSALTATGTSPRSSAPHGRAPDAPPGRGISPSIGQAPTVSAPPQGQGCTLDAPQPIGAALALARGPGGVGSCRGRRKRSTAVPGAAWL